VAVTAEALRLQAELDAQVQNVTDAHTRALVAAWVAAWAEVSGDLQQTLEELLTGSANNAGRLTRLTMLRSVRLRGMLQIIARHLSDLADEARITITSDLRKVVADAVTAQRQILAAQLPDGAVDLLADRQVTDRALAAIVRRTTEQITSDLQPLSRTAYAAVRRELIRGVAVGSGPRQTAARMVQRAEGGFNGGLTRALVISRTEMLDAHRVAAAEEQALHADVLAGWIWLCHLSPRTCPSCLVKHGTFHELDEPGPQDHPQGRCARMPKVKGWAELGFDVDEPDDHVPDAREFFDGLTRDQQVAMLGRRRYDLLMSGAIEWDDLTTRRTTSGWRDSWVVTPVRDLVAQTRGGSRTGRVAS
jgi:hypothetical protein